MEVRYLFEDEASEAGSQSSGTSSGASDDFSRTVDAGTASSYASGGPLPKGACRDERGRGGCRTGAGVRSGPEWIKPGATESAKEKLLSRQENKGK